MTGHDAIPPPGNRIVGRVCGGKNVFAWDRFPFPVSESDGPKQVDDPNYHNVDHTAVQTCGWTKYALLGEGKC